MSPSTKTGKGFSSFSVIVVFAALMLMGVSVLPLIDLQLEPSRSLPSLTVSFTWPNASARVIEQKVTTRLEGMFSSVRGIREMNSVSYRGRGTIELSFKKHTNPDAIRFEIASLIRRVYPDLPDQVSYPELSMSTEGRNIRPVLTYNLNASASPYYIQSYAENNIAPRLSSIKGIKEIRVYGAVPYEWEIRFDVELIHTLGITAGEIEESIHSFFRKDFIGTGSVKFPDQDYEKELPVSIHTGMAGEPEWDKIPVKKIDSRIIYLTDLAKVRYREQLPNFYYRINGLNTIYMVVYPEKEVNNLSLAADVKSGIETIKKNLPPGYSILLSYDATEYIAKEIRKIALRTLFSMVILLTFVLLISRQFRYLLLIFVSLIANLIIACIFYYLFKIEIHLYSLAGITVSFGIIIDNSIVMIDHILHSRNKKVFLAILAATLTTIGALSILFFLKEEQRVNLTDFALVVMVNLTVSLLIALFFIPALMDKIRLHALSGVRSIRRKRRIIRITGAYERSVLFGKKYKWLFILLLVFGFGIPLYLLPDHIEKEGFWSRFYNNTLGSNWYQENARPIVEKITGGTLRLFSEHVYDRSFYSSPQRTTLYIRGQMPEGSTVHQLNEAISKMENQISRYDEVEMFQTSVTGYRNSSIVVYFKPEYEDGAFPYRLKEELTSKAVNFGGLDWSIYGVGRGFSNALYSDFRNSRITLEGYNYDQLYQYAELLRKKLLENPRIQVADITGSGEWMVTSLHEYFIGFNLEQFGLYNIPLTSYYGYLNDRMFHRSLAKVFHNGEAQPVTLVSDNAGVFTTWDLNNNPVQIGKTPFKSESLSNINKQRTGNNIYKYNQQYRLVVAYDFIGVGQLAQRVMERHVDEMNALLPLGYKAEIQGYGGWYAGDEKQYYLLFLVILIIYFICSILLESFLQPFAIIGMIPVSFIGVFLTFYLLDFNFDQGGFASFILLSGIVVNSGLYIINDYNNFRRKADSPGEPGAAGSNSPGDLESPGEYQNLKLYLKAFNHKIIPVFLTVVSTILGLVPFVWAGQNEVFWFAFAAGAMGGLVFSFIAVIGYLPLFMKLNVAS